MERKIIDLGSRYESAFGFIGASGDSVQGTGFNDSLTGAKVYVQNARSAYEAFTLRRDGVTLNFAFSDFKNNANVFAPPAMLSFKQSKMIGETIVNTVNDKGKVGQWGQVVEMYGPKPVEITMQILLIDMDTHTYPSSKVKALTALFNYNGIWEVEGQIWRDKQIQSIYFTDCDDGPVQGFEDTWQASLQAKSIAPVEYAFNKPQTRTLEKT